MSRLQIATQRGDIIPKFQTEIFDLKKIQVHHLVGQTKLSVEHSPWETESVGNNDQLFLLILRI